MLRVSELPVTRWPPGADVDFHCSVGDISSLFFLVDIYALAWLLGNQDLHEINREVKTMRRSAAKSRADKSRIDSGSVNAAPPPPHSVQPVEAVDIVPGLLTESTWTSMLNKEEGEEVVVDIIAELMDRLMDRCYQVYLKRQLIPFSVWWAQNNLVETIESIAQCFTAETVIYYFIKRHSPG
ncbi:hypothetical protein F2P79_004429 [Pimephales promelas]|nr:hypothetical protein F2P79_004429 [Pimephales promelas]